MTNEDALDVTRRQCLALHRLNLKCLKYTIIHEHIWEDSDWDMKYRLQHKKLAEQWDKKRLIVQAKLNELSEVL